MDHRFIHGEVCDPYKVVFDAVHAAQRDAIRWLMGELTSDQTV